MAYKLFESYINENSFVLKIDIKKYFYSIDHDMLLKLVKKKIKDSYVLDLITQVIETTNDISINQGIRIIKEKEIWRIKKLNISNKEKEEKIDQINAIPEYKLQKGLPIGNMTSQILAIYYLNEVDHYIKEELKVDKYIRYMDDLIIVSDDYNWLKEIMIKIINKIKEYKLDVNSKCRINDIKKGVEFLGYRYKYLDKKLVIRYNKQTIKRISRRLNALKHNDIEMYFKSFGSYQGYLSRSNTKLKV